MTRRPASSERIEEPEKRVLGRVFRHMDPGAESHKGRGHIGREAEMGDSPEVSRQSRLLRQPDDEIRAPP